ncbi:MAG: AAA family ATPase [Clostridiales bacterium]|nr:AAA family ATPase [Clostridiales bacterium]
MGTGIILCGLNGAGKSTLGRALAKKLDFYFIDSEDLYFPKENPDAPYAVPRTRQEAKRLLLNEMEAHESFVFASVKGDYGEDISAFFQYAVFVDVPKEIRVQRVKSRSFAQFGNRMLKGGDLYEQEQRFFDFVESRDKNTVEEWVRSLHCPVIRIDGTKPIEKNVALILSRLQTETPYGQGQIAH